MATEKEILRQKLELKRTHRAVAKALDISNGAFKVVNWLRPSGQVAI